MKLAQLLCRFGRHDFYVSHSGPTGMVDYLECANCGRRAVRAMTICGPYTEKETRGQHRQRKFKRANIDSDEAQSG